MIPYVERAIFRSAECRIFRRAIKAVGFLNDTWLNELRCHELARAVHRLLFATDATADEPYAIVVDGKLAAVEHSWIEIIVPVESKRVSAAFLATGRTYETHEGGWRRRVILDVYVPGRLPQVQLIDPFHMLRHGYEADALRTDIDEQMVTTLHDEIRDNWLASITSRRA
jgi:hypothetical protein